jgi:Uma2 family endonuclease
MDLPKREVAAGDLTYEEYRLFPDDGRRHELIGGEHHVTPSPTAVHQRFLRKLGRILDEFVTAHALGEVFFAPLDVVLSRRDVVQPDLIFISNARLGRLTRENVRGAPDLVVEVVSEASRQTDRKLKRALYEKYDVVEYWVADPELRILEVFRRDEANRLAKVAEFEDAGTLVTPLLPGLEIDLAALW